jgi:cytochrome c
MKPESIRALLSSALLVLSCGTPVALAQPSDKPAASAMRPGPLGFTSERRGSAKQAKALLDRAADFMAKNPKERAFAAFNNQKGHFIQGDLYVFAFDLESGIMQAHGGEPEGLVGMNVMDLRDAAGKPLIREMADVAKKDGAGTVDYVWLNRVTNHVEQKTTFVKRVGQTVIGVGYYTPRGSPEEARSLLERAAEALQADARTALAAFNDPRGRFTHYDLYVFAVGLEDKKFHAFAANPGLVGADVADLRDAKGKPIIRDMIALVKDKGEGVVEYVWRNPANNKVESKHSYVKRVDKYLIGVGYYTR